MPAPATADAADLAEMRALDALERMHDGPIPPALRAAVVRAARERAAADPETTDA